MTLREGIHVRLTPEERKALERAAARGNKTRSQVIRELIMGMEITNDLKRSHADEARAIRVSVTADLEIFRQRITQSLLDVRAELRDDVKKSAVATVEAITGKKVVAIGDAK